MGARNKYACQQCSYSQIGWAGRCPNCGSWGSLFEVTEAKTVSKVERGKTSKPVSLVSISPKVSSRISTKIQELDRVLGGGLVDGQVVLIAGEPGIGKSTLLLQVANNLKNTLYISGEESSFQVALRAKRLEIKNKTLKFLEETDVDSILSVSSENLLQKKLETKQKLLVIDSIQTLFTSDVPGMAGAVSQVRECAFKLVRFAKKNNVPIFIIGHVTKEGTVAGPSVLMHIVDTVLWFEGDKSSTLRILRAVKNRFGPTDEVGIFEMGERGLLSVDDPEKLFLNVEKESPGNCITAILQGTRVLLVEIQSLVVPTKMVYPKRIAQGFDISRFELLLAVIQRRLGIPLNEFDCFLNVSGGINLRNDPSVDLAVCLSTVSAYFDKPLPKRSIAIGEVGLLGDVRSVIAQVKRIKEAKLLGYKFIITSNEVKYLQEATRKFLR